MGSSCEYWLRCAYNDLQSLQKCLKELAGASDGTVEAKAGGWDVHAPVDDIAALDSYCTRLAGECVHSFIGMFAGTYPLSNQVLQALHLHVSRGLNLYSYGGNSGVKDTVLGNFKGSVRAFGVRNAVLDKSVTNDNQDSSLSVIVCRLYFDIVCTLHKSLVVAGWRRQLKASLVTPSDPSGSSRDSYAAPCVNLDQVITSRNWFILLDSKLSSLDICYWKCRCELYNLQLYAFWFALKDAWWLYSIPNWLESKMPFLSQVPRPFNKRKCSVTEFVTVIMRLRQVVGNVDDLFFNDHVDEDGYGDYEKSGTEDYDSQDYRRGSLEAGAAPGGIDSPIADYYSFFKFKQPFSEDDDDELDVAHIASGAAQKFSTRNSDSSMAFKVAPDVDAGFEVVYTASGRRSSNNIWVDMKHQGGIDPKWQDFNDITFDLAAWQANAQVFNLSDDESLPSLGEITSDIDKTSRSNENEDSGESNECTASIPRLAEEDITYEELPASTDDFKGSGTSVTEDDATPLARGASFSMLDSFQYEFDPELLTNVRRLIFDHNGWFMTTTSALVHFCCAALSESFCLCAHANPSYNTTPWIMSQLGILENLDNEAWMTSMMMSTAISGLYQRLVLLVADTTLGWLEPRLSEAPFLPWPMLDQYDSCGNIYTLVAEEPNEDAPVYKNAIVIEVVARMILKLQTEVHGRKITQEQLVYKCMALNEWICAIGADDIVVIKRLVQLVDQLKRHYKLVTIQQIGQLVHDFWYSSLIKTTLPRHGKAAAITSTRGACAFEKFGIEAYLCSVLGGYNSLHFNVWLGQGVVHKACIHGSLVLIFNDACQLQPVAFIDLKGVACIKPVPIKGTSASTTRANTPRLVLVESCTMLKAPHSHEMYHTSISTQGQWYKHLEKLVHVTRQDSPKIHWPKPLV